MKRLFRAVPRTICVFACVALLAGNVLRAFAMPEDIPSPAQPPDCETQQQLLELLAQNDGGTVTLTGDIEWNDSVSFGLHVSSPTTIEMGDFGITVRGSLFLGNGLNLAGNGVSSPLITVENGGHLDMGNVGVVSSGDRGVTLRLEAGAILSSVKATRVAALGDNAVAIDCGGDIELQGGLFEAPGPGGTAIRAGGTVDIDSCVIYAGDTGISAAGNVAAFYSAIEGATAAILSGSGTVALDCVEASPEPEGADIVTRLAIPYGWYNLARYGVCLEPGQPLDLITQMEYYLVNTDDPEDIEKISLGVDWETDGCDLNTPGKYSLYVSAPDALVQIEGFSRSEVPLYVVEPTVPWLANPMWFGSDCAIFLAGEITDTQDVSLLYSEDEGETWLDAMADFNGSFDVFAFSLSGLDEEKTYWFRMVVTGGLRAGESNILKVSGDMASFVEDNRDGGDREGGLTLPPVTGNDGPAEFPGQNGDDDDDDLSDGDGSDGDGSDGDDSSDDSGSDDNAEAHRDPPEGVSQPEEPLPREEPDAVPVQAEAPSVPAGPEGSLHYSADEIADMIAANPRRLVFISGDMRAAIPAGAMAALAGESGFSIWMERPGDARFAIRMFTGDGELHDLGGEEFEVYIAHSSGGDVVCTDEEGNLVPVRVEEDVAVCQLVRTGAYTLAGAASQGDKYQVVDSSRPAGDGTHSAPGGYIEETEHPAANSGGGSPWRWMLLSAFTAASVVCVTHALRLWRGRSGG